MWTTDAASDFVNLLRSTFGQALRLDEKAQRRVIVIRIGESSLSRPESYRLHIQPATD